MRFRFLRVHEAWSTGEGGKERRGGSGLEVASLAVEVSAFATRGRRVLPGSIGCGVVLIFPTSSSEELSGVRSDSSALWSTRVGSGVTEEVNSLSTSSFEDNGVKE